MSIISPEQAEREFGITCHHEIMENGERRFRLRKSDGTAYIRTEANELGAWQEAHYHSTVRETYIVQSGWVALAELHDAECIISVYAENDVFTTEPNVVHNVYRSANSVLHTVKHGVASGSDRAVDSRSEAFTARTLALSEGDIIKQSRPRGTRSKETGPPEFNESYRHFDNLIWQVPALSSAIFALSIQALGEDVQGNIANVTYLETRSVTAGIFGFTALATGCFAFVLYRFRKHQRSLKPYSATNWWSSASTWTQLLVIAQTIVLIWLSSQVMGAPPLKSLFIAIAALVGIGWLTEWNVRRQKTPVRPR